MTALQNPASALQARLVACGRCRCALIHALDAPVAAFEVRLDPEPLGLAEELQALTAGRMTYDLIAVGHHHEIAYRDQWRIRQRKYPVLATHQCPGRIPANLAQQFQTSTTKGDHDAQRPPF